MGIRHNVWQAAMFMAILMISTNGRAEAGEQSSRPAQTTVNPGLEIQTTGLRIIVRTFDYANLTGSAAKEMITEARWIFLNAGIETTWVNCRSQGQSESDPRTCQSPLGPTGVVLRILAGDIPASARLPETALGYAPSSERMADRWPAST